MELIANGTHWYYESYDHKAAKEEIRLNNPNTPDEYLGEYVPNEVKQNHIVWRKGKLRSLKFDPDCLIQVMYVGRNHRFAKSFLPFHVGQSIKPILHIQADKYNLIKAGIAVDEKTLKL